MCSSDLGITGEEKLKRWELALKIKNSSDPVDVTVEEASLLKKLLTRIYGTIVVGQAYKLLEDTKSEKAAVPNHKADRRS